MSLEKFIGKPVEIEAAEIVQVVDFDWEGLNWVKVKNGGRVFVAEGSRCEVGDFLILEQGRSEDGYVCPKDVFINKYRPANEVLT